jgi:hypothetical protein
MEWSTTVGSGEAAKRAGGRRKFNARRRREMWRRRFAMLHLYCRHGEFPHGSLVKLAAHFGCSPVAISRDIKWVRKVAKNNIGWHVRCSLRKGRPHVVFTWAFRTLPDGSVVMSGEPVEPIKIF